MNLALSEIPDASRVRMLLADGGKHMFDGGVPIPVAARDPVKETRSYVRKKSYKSTGISARLRALKVGDKPLIEPKKHQPHAGSFAQAHPPATFKTATMGCGAYVRIWRVT